MSQTSFEKTFGLSTVFIESTLMEYGGVAESSNPSTLIKEAIHVISCGYEEKTAWGKEVGINVGDNYICGVVLEVFEACMAIDEYDILVLIEIYILARYTYYCTQNGLYSIFFVRLVGFMGQSLRIS